MQTFADRVVNLWKSKERLSPTGRNTRRDYLTFLGRLQSPLAEIGDTQQMMEWIKDHNKGYVVLRPPS